MKHIKVLGLGLSFLFVACSADEAPKAERTFLKKQNSEAIVANEFNRSMIWESKAATKSACAVVDALNLKDEQGNIVDAEGVDKFALLKNYKWSIDGASGTIALNGQMDIANFPLALLALGDASKNAQMPTEGESASIQQTVMQTMMIPDDIFWDKVVFPKIQADLAPFGPNAEKIIGVVMQYLGGAFGNPQGSEQERAAAQKQAVGQIAALAGGDEATAIAVFGKLAELFGAKATDQLFRVKFAGIQEKIQEKMPGVYGQDGLILSIRNKADGTQEVNSSLAGAFILRSIKKINPPALIKLNSPEVRKILTAVLPLFSKDRSWKSWQKEMEVALDAAAAGSQIDDMNENLCGMLLWQRAFAQLLAIKGFQAPKLNAERTQLAQLECVNGPEGTAPCAATNLGSIDSFAAYMSTDLIRKPLSPAEIAEYDLSKNLDPKLPEDQKQKLLFPGNMLPLLSDTRMQRPASFADTLAMVNALVKVKEMTSPAAIWRSTGFPNILGDIASEDRKNKAILPPEINSLALGLSVIAIQNLNAINLHKVDRNGIKVTKENEDDARGIMIFDNLLVEQAGEISLANLSKLAVIAVRLDDALASLQKMDPNNRSQQLAFYSIEAMLKLKKLQTSLKELKYPLALLMIRLAEPNETKEACLETLEWNVKWGKAINQAICSEEVKEAYKRALRMIAIDLKSPALIRRVNNSK